MFLGRNSFITGGVAKILGLFTWGEDTHGQLGLNNTTYYSSPKQVGTLKAWTKVMGGRQCAMALKSDGTLWSWGINTYGGLGLGDTVKRSSPVQVGALNNWASIGGGGYNCFGGIKTDGTLWTWGQNSWGKLMQGTGSTAHLSSPVQVGTLTGWIKFDNDNQTSAALKSDGTLWTAGYNTPGGLGTGNIIHRSSPTQVGGTTWSNIEVGDNIMIALRSDGTMWSWGAGSFGATGHGNSTP